MPENEDIVVANMPSTAPEISTLIEDDSVPSVVPTQKTATPMGPMAVPGYAERDDGNFGKQDDDEADFFLKDLPKKQESEPEAEGAGTSPAADGEGEPVARVSPPPAEPSPEIVSNDTIIDPRLLEIADSFGLTREEAMGYETTDRLLQTLRIIARNLPGVEEGQAPSTPAGTAQPKPPAPPPPEPDIELPDPAALEQAGFDPALVSMAKSMRAMHDRYKSKLEHVDKLHAEMTKDMAERHAERRQRAVEETFKEAGFDAKQFKQADLQKIVSRVSALYRVYQEEGAVPPTSDLIKMAIPLVVKDAKPKEAGTPQTQEAQAAKRRAEAAAKARSMARNGLGQFTGMPSHRRGGESVNGGALRQFLQDRGIEPRGATSPDDRSGFLPG